VADSIDDIVVSVGRGGGGSVQTLVYDGTVSAAANTVLKSFTPYTAAQRPNAAVFGAAVDADGNGQVDRFLVTQGDAGGPAGIANVSIAGAKSTTPVTSLVGPLRIAAPRTVFQPQTVFGTVSTRSQTSAFTAGTSRPMQIREIVTGSGAVANTWDKLTVQYTGMLTNGTVFDSSRQTGRTAFELTLGASQVIPGWEAGLVGMKVGGRRLLEIPPELAYGDSAQSKIPAGSKLVFDVELVSVTPNRAATITGTATGSVTEDGTTTTGGTLAVTDPDHSPPGNVQNGFRQPGSLAGTYGTFTFTAATGVWGYTLDSARAVTQALTAGQSVTDTLTVTSIDGTASHTITVTVNGAGETPTDISLSGTSVAENSLSGTAVGTLSTTDVDSVAPFSYALVSGAGSADNASFTIDGSTLKTAASFDFETKSSYSIRIRSTDSNGLTTEKPFTITLTNVNEGPTNITLSSSTVAENAAAGATVGTFSTTDVDVGDTFTYALVSGTGDTDNASFTIVGNALQTAATFNFETKSSYSICVRSTDSGGLTTEKQFTVTVTNVNEGPTNITLSSSTVAENAAAGATVGTFSTTDVDSGDTFTYALVSGDAGVDNASFTIVGNALQTAATFNFETKSSYTIRVQTTDSGGLTTEKQFTITVTNLDEAPTDITLSPSTVAENSAAGTTVGTFSTADVDVGDTFTYALVSGDVYTDNASFTIVGNALQTAASFDFETKSSYSIRVQSTDGGGLTTEKSFTITVTNVNDAPTDIALSAATVRDGSPSGTAVGTLSTTDQDVGDAFTYEFASGDGDTDNGSFTIDAQGVLTTAADVDFATQGSYSVRVRSTDAIGLPTEKAFTITVNRIAAISGDTTGSLLADDAGATASGTLTVTDPDAGEAAFRAPASLVGTYGDFTFDAEAGAWTYALDTTRLETVVLTSDQIVTDSLMVMSQDGTASTKITVSITGYTMQTVTGIVNTPSPTLDVPAGFESTIRYREYSPGTGDFATAGKVIDAYYIGLLANGSVFQARWPGDSPVPPLTALLDTASPYPGISGLIPGWVYGLEGMQVGGIRILVIPPELAYGDDGSPGAGIPGGETLTFIVALQSVSDPPAP
jgi:VCBS repeat-containing protein